LPLGYRVLPLCNLTQKDRGALARFGVANGVQRAKGDDANANASTIREPP
jgi:hypothetical protein